MSASTRPANMPPISNTSCAASTLPMTISIGEPKRNKDYQKAHFPKRTTDDTESQAMARFAVVEHARGHARRARRR